MHATRPITKAFQWDLARQVERIDVLLRWLPRYAAWGYEELYLHLEDAVAYPSLPTVARADSYPLEEFVRLVEAATAAGIRVVPIVNLLGHTQYLIKAEALRDLNELRDASGRPLGRGQICPLHPRTLEVATALLRDLAPFCTAGKVHAGLDESFLLGRCPRCRSDIARRGLGAHFAVHVERLNRLARRLGLRLGLWGDMLALAPDAIPWLPADVTVYDWYYYPFRRLPRVELFNFAEADLAAPLQARGIGYYGCPMNGAFRWEPLPLFTDRMRNIIDWWRRCARVGADGFLVTSWEPGRLAFDLTVAVDAAAAGLWLEPGEQDPAALLRRGFERAFGGADGGRLAARAALAADAFPFCGYHRWQINDRWDVLASPAGAAPFAGEQRALAGITRKAAAGPRALAASLAFRLYLARRDVFVRRAAQAVWRLRRALARGARGEALRLAATARSEAAAFAAAIGEGTRAARTMWRLSRDRRVAGPNERMLAADRGRLRSWQRWLGRVARKPELCRETAPVCGAWQLLFTVRNFAPALQKVVVEQRRPDGAWTALHALHTIEFRAEAARPRTAIRREFSVPVPGGAEAAAPVVLRIGIRGVGQLEVSGARLTDGVVSLRPAGGCASRTLGRPAPRGGFPAIDWERNAGEVVLRFP